MKNSKKKKSVNILHIIDSLGIGGAEIHLLNTIKNLPEYNHVVVYLRSPEDLFENVCSWARVRKLPFKGNWSLLACAWKLYKIIKEDNIDLIHAHLWLATVIARLGTPAKIPLFFTIHSMLGKDAFKKSKLMLLIERLTYRKNHYLLAVSNEVLHDYEKHIYVKGEKTVVYNFVDDIFFETKKKYNPHGPLRLIAIGNLKAAKNYPYLLDCIKGCKNVELDIYGDGSLRQQLEEMVASMNLDVQLKGRSQKIHELLPRYDVFVMASVHEGFGIALAEAMACGLPVLVSDIPAFRELAGETGFYFSLSGTSEFARSIELLRELKQNGRLTDFGAKSRERVLKISSKERYLEKIKSIYGSRL